MGGSDVQGGHGSGVGPKEIIEQELAQRPSFANVVLLRVRGSASGISGGDPGWCLIGSVPSEEDRAALDDLLAAAGMAEHMAVEVAVGGSGVQRREWGEGDLMDFLQRRGKHASPGESWYCQDIRYGEVWLLDLGRGVAWWSSHEGVIGEWLRGDVAILAEREESGHVRIWFFAAGDGVGFSASEEENGGGPFGGRVRVVTGGVGDRVGVEELRVGGASIATTTLSGSVCIGDEAVTVEIVGRSDTPDCEELDARRRREE